MYKFKNYHHWIKSVSPEKGRVKKEISRNTFSFKYNFVLNLNLKCISIKWIIITFYLGFVIEIKNKQ